MVGSRKPQRRIRHTRPPIDVQLDTNKVMTGCRDVFVADAYLRVTVGEDQLVVDCHRFSLCQRFNQQLLFDLREPTQVNPDIRRQAAWHSMESRGNKLRCYLKQVRERSQDLWWSHIQTFVSTCRLTLVGHVAQIQDGRKHRKDPATQNFANWNGSNNTRTVLW